MERAGNRKYSVLRLASARGEEAARRAMPTRLAAASGGGGNCCSASRWRGTGGKRDREELFARVFGFREPGNERAVVRVAIARLDYGISIFAFYSPCQACRVRFPAAAYGA